MFDSSREYEETRSERLKSKWRSVEFSSVAKRCRKGRWVRGDSLQQERTRIFWIFLKVQRVRGDSQRSGRKTQNPSTVTTQCGHTTSTYLLPPSRILTKYSRMCRRNMVANPANMWRIYILPRISLNEHWKSYSVRRESSSRIRMKSNVYTRSTGSNKLGRGQLYLLKKAVQLSNEKKNMCPTQYCEKGQNPVKAWKEKNDWLQNSLQQKELDRIDGEPMEFEWKIFPGFTTLQILAEIQNVMTEIKCEPEQFQGRIIIMSMCNDVVWWEKVNKELCIASSVNVAKYARRFAPSHWSFLGPGKKTKWWGPHTYKPNGEWDTVAEIMMINFCESGHPVFRGSSALERGDLKSKGEGTLSFQFNGSDEIVEVVFSHNHFRQSAQYLWSSGGYVWRASLRNLQMFRGYGETRSTERFGGHGNANRIFDNKWNPSDRWESTGRPVARLWAKVRKSSRSP